MAYKLSPKYEMDDRSLLVVFAAGTMEVSFSTTFRLALPFPKLPVKLLPGYHLRR
jgi:hypothetical protein